MITILSTSTLVKKRLFEKQSNDNVNKKILSHLGKISTNVNLLKFYSDDEIKGYIQEIEEEVDAIWPIL